MFLVDKIVNNVGKKVSVVHFLIRCDFVYDVEFYEQILKRIFKS